MAGHFTIPQLPKDKELAVKLLDNANSIDRLKAERGVLGGIWGSTSNVAHNMAALLIVTLLIIGVGFTLMKYNVAADDKSLSIKDFWSIITPMITLAIGYLFGDKKKSEA
jgi:hypothetical protein